LYFFFNYSKEKHHTNVSMRDRLWVTNDYFLGPKLAYFAYSTIIAWEFVSYICMHVWLALRLLLLPYKLKIKKKIPSLVFSTKIVKSKLPEIPGIFYKISNTNKRLRFSHFPFIIKKSFGYLEVFYRPMFYF
jgi:hypothetical protein